ncbi:MAG: FAD-dependent oxidoreductase [Caldilineaceae bacterium]|nr:FAD-dependent oxidoreductase [Caldilineaceae bacterium]
MYHYDLAIVGGGPAGLAAAATALNAHLNVAIISPDMGGKANYGFALRDLSSADSVWGTDLVHQLEATVHAYPERHLKKTVSAVECGETGGFQLTLVGAQDVEQTVQANALIVTTGAEPQRLYLPGEREYLGRGISYSTVSHAGYMQGRKVAVVGSGTRAITAALRLAPIADHVYLIPATALPEADNRVVQLMNHPKITVLQGWEPQQFLGDAFLTQIVIVRESVERALDVDAVFVEMGLLPGKAFLRDVVDFDPETGQIPINQLCETAVPGLYAAGDVTNTYAEQIPVAIGEGIKAALSAWQYLVTKH